MKILINIILIPLALFNLLVLGVDNTIIDKYNTDDFFSENIFDIGMVTGFHMLGKVDIGNGYLDTNTGVVNIYSYPESNDTPNTGVMDKIEITYIYSTDSGDKWGYTGNIPSIDNAEVFHSGWVNLSSEVKNSEYIATISFKTELIILLVIVLTPTLLITYIKYSNKHEKVIVKEGTKFSIYNHK